MIVAALFLCASGTGSQSTVDVGVADDALRRLFTPLSAPAGTYTVFRSPRTIDELAATLKALDATPSKGAWEPQRPEIGGAFGQAGVYDRARLGRLFNGRRVTVVRGSMDVEGRRRAYTLVSPYPDPTLSHVADGTMVIAIDLGPATPAP